MIKCNSLVYSLLYILIFSFTLIKRLHNWILFHIFVLKFSHTRDPIEFHQFLLFQENRSCQRSSGIHTTSRPVPRTIHNMADSYLADPYQRMALMVEISSFIVL